MRPKCASGARPVYLLTGEYDRGPREVETWVRERLLDTVARELGKDPIEIGRKNLVLGEPDDRLITGPSLSDVSSRQSLDRVLELAGYDQLRADQARARAEGRYVGIGFATFIEPAPGPVGMRAGPFSSESARVRPEADGHLVVITAQSPHGQGHETTLAQIADDEVGVPIDHGSVVHGDTDVTPFSLLGTGGSRSAAWASGAVMHTTRKVKEKVLAIASDILEISSYDLEIADGLVSAKGFRQKSIPVAEVAYRALMGQTPAGQAVLLEVSEIYRGEGIGGSGWSGGTHLCCVEVDIQTGSVTILRWIAVEDCGRLINPAIVEGQVRGGVTQGSPASSTNVPPTTRPDSLWPRPLWTTCCLRRPRSPRSRSTIWRPSQKAMSTFAEWGRPEPWSPHQCHRGRTGTARCAD